MVKHGADAHVEALADRWVDGWLASVAQAGYSATWREEQARRLGEVVRTGPVLISARNRAALQRFLDWVQQAHLSKECSNTARRPPTADGGGGTVPP